MSAYNTPISIDEIEMLLHQIRVAGEGISQCTDAQEEGLETRLTYLLADTIEHKVEEVSKLLRGVYERDRTHNNV